MSESVKVVVIGAGGLVGLRMVEKLCAMKTFYVSPTESLPLSCISLFDINPISLPPCAKTDKRVEVTVGDMTCRATLDKLLTPNGATRVTTIQLAALLSGYAEQNFDLGLAVNLQGSLTIMEAVRAVGVALKQPQTYVFTSTDYVACYNSTNRSAPVTEESFRLSPVSYGVQKACVELLLCDYSRKGLIDGRVGRLSAVLGRPGWSNSISWSYTGIFTQPLEGKDFEVPGSLPMDRPYPCSCIRNNVECLLHLAGKTDAAKLGHNRVVQVPARSFTLKEIWAACQQVAREEGVTRLGALRMGELPEGAAVKELNVCPRVDISKAVALGLPNDVSIHEIIRDYIKTHLRKKPTAKL